MTTRINLHPAHRDKFNQICLTHRISPASLAMSMTSLCLSSEQALDVVLKQADIIERDRLAAFQFNDWDDRHYQANLLKGKR